MLAALKNACVFLLFAALLTSEPLLGKPSTRLVRIKQFATLNGLVNFLPGAWVGVREGHRQTYYMFHNDKYLQAEPPDLIRKWEDFDWNGVDYLNQIAIQSYNLYLDKFLPDNKLVKKVVEIPLFERNNALFIVCFTEKATEQFARPGSTDIYFAGIASKTASSETSYKLLWIRKVESDASYGDLKVQEIPKLGRFVVLYWADMGGSGGVDALDIYRVKE